MNAILLLILAAMSTYFPLWPLDAPQQKDAVNEFSLTSEMVNAWNAQSLNEIDLMLHNASPTLHGQVINKVLMTLKCASQYNVDHNNILTIIDYSMPSNEKRLWVFDIKERKLLFNTYVSHGIKSGSLVSNYFSNKNNSKASSIGVYKTQEAYYGRDGLSLRLDGLDRNFNDNASNRSVVMHSGWYVEERFIKKYGRPGRSWGCPALPLENSQAIINTIKDKSLLVIYYPSDRWFNQSKFLNCGTLARSQTMKQFTLIMPEMAPDDQRDAILLISGKGIPSSETNPVAVISADRYQQIFHEPPPLTRMLRRQINNEEYIALSTSELNYLASTNLGTNLDMIYFVIPILKVVRGGYYETQMQVVNLGKIKEIKVNMSGSIGVPFNRFTVFFEGRPAVNLVASSQFIRWVGL
jgi:hypothetical protein